MGVLNVGVLQATIRLKDNLSSALDNAAKKMRKFGAKTQRIGKQLATSISLPIIGAAAGAIAASETMDKALRAITVGTGAAGQTLDGLKASFLTVFREVPQSADTVATVIADMNTILGATGPALENLTRMMLDGSRVMGMEAAPNGIKFARVIKQFGIPVEQAAGTLDMFFATSQRTGMSLEDLISKTGDFAVVLGNAGFSLEESAALFGSLSSAGIPVTRIMPGLNAAFRRWAKEGRNASDMLGVTIEKLKATTDPMVRLNMATEAFGAEGANRLMKAVEAGVLNLDDMTRAIEGTAGAISRATLENKTFSESLLILKNRSTAALAPFGKELKRALVGFMPIVEGMFKKLNKAGEAFGKLSPKARNMAIAAAAVAAALGPVLIAVGALTASVGAILPIVTGFVGGLAILASWPAVLAAAFVLLVLKVKPFRDLLFAIANLIKTSVLGVFDLLKWAAVGLAQMLGKVIGFFANWIPGLKKVGGMLDSLTGIVDGATDKINDLRDVTGDAVVATEDLGEEVQATTAAVKRAAPVVQSLTTATAKATAATDDLTDAEKSLQKQITGQNLRGEIASLDRILQNLIATNRLTENGLIRLGKAAQSAGAKFGAKLTPALKRAALAAYNATEWAESYAATLRDAADATDSMSVAGMRQANVEREQARLHEQITIGVGKYSASLQQNQKQTHGVSDALGTLDGFLSQAGTAFSNLANIAGDSFGGIFKKVGLVIGKIKAMIETVKSVKGVFDSIKSLGTLFGGAATATGNLAAAGSGVGASMGGLGAMFGKISLSINPMTAAIALGGIALFTIAKGFKSVKARAAEYWAYLDANGDEALARQRKRLASMSAAVRAQAGPYGTGSTEFGGEEWQRGEAASWAYLSDEEKAAAASGAFEGRMAERNFQSGTGGRFVDFGRGTLAMLHGREAIVPAGTTGPTSDALAHEIKALRAELRTDRTFQLQLIPKMLAATMQQSGALS